MRLLLYIIGVITLLSITGCIIVPEDRDRGGHWEHHDEGWHDGGHGDHD